MNPIQPKHQEVAEKLMDAGIVSKGANYITQLLANEFPLPASPGLKSIPFRPYESAHNWPEDCEHENGLYQNECCYCHKIFYGHKRRVICKLCASYPTSKGVTE